MSTSSGAASINDNKPNLELLQIARSHGQKDDMESNSQGVSRVQMLLRSKKDNGNEAAKRKLSNMLLRTRKSGSNSNMVLKTKNSGNNSNMLLRTRKSASAS